MKRPKTKFITIKVFFCYSSNMKQDEQDLYAALSRYNWPYKRVVDLELVDWLSFLKTKNGKRLTPQEIFNKQILKSDYVIFLIKNEFGPNARQEWDLCINSSKTKPRIMLGIRIDPHGKSVETIREELGSKDIIIDTAYENLDTFTLSIIHAIDSDIINSLFRELSKTDRLISPKSNIPHANANVNKRRRFIVHTNYDVDSRRALLSLTADKFLPTFYVDKGLDKVMMRNIISTRKVRSISRFKHHKGDDEHIKFLQATIEKWR